MSEIYALSGGQAPRRSSQMRMSMGRKKCADERNIRTERRAGAQTKFTMKINIGRKNSQKRGNKRECSAGFKKV